MALLACLLLPTCSPPRTPLRVGLVEWPPYEIAFLARERGFLDPKRVTLVEFQSPAEAARAYLAGGLDLVALTLDFGLDFQAKDPDHRVCLVIDESLGGDSVISAKPLGQLHELAGKRIGLEGSSLGAYMLYRLLEKAGLKESDVKLAYFDIPDQEAAFLAGKVDVMITYEPGRSKMLKAGGHEIFSSREIPGEILDVFMARQSQVRERLDDFRHFTSTWFRALEEFRGKPESASPLLAPRLQMSPEEFITSLKGAHLFNLEDNRRMLGTGREEFLASIARFATSMRSRQTLPMAATSETLLTDVALPRSTPKTR